MAPRTQEGSDLATRLDALQAADLVSLRATWQKLYRASPPDHISRDLLARAVAHRLQEVALGGLRPAAKRKLTAWSGSLAAEAGAQPPAAAVRLKPGATLVRTWRGTTHNVQVRDDGFAYQGQRYASLSHIAQVITGTHWSGPRFFGLSQSARSGARDAAAADTAEPNAADHDAATPSAATSDSATHDATAPDAPVTEASHAPRR